MPFRLKEDRQYQRFKHTDREKKILEKQGFTPVVSSNVSAIARDEKILFVRFHDSSVYAYPRSGGLFDRMLSSASKGKFVWDELIRKNVPYYRTSEKNVSIPVPQGAQANPMKEAEQEKRSLGKSMLVGLALATMLTPQETMQKASIVSLALANIINGNPARSGA